MLRGVGGYVAARWRPVCVSAGSLWPIRRVSIRLVFIPRHPNRTIAAVAVAFANFTGVLTNSVSADDYLIAPRGFGGYAISLSTQQLLAVVMILFLTATNTRGLKTGKLIQNTFTFTKTAALIGLIVIGLTLGWNHGSAAYTSDWWNPVRNSWHPTAAQLGFDPINSGGALMALALVMLLGRSMVVRDSLSQPGTMSLSLAARYAIRDGICHEPY